MKNIMTFLLLVLGVSVFAQNSNQTKPSDASRLYVDVKIPEMALFSDKTLGKSQFQLSRYGLGVEYKFKGNFSIGLDADRRKNSYTLLGQDCERKGYSVSPSLRYYFNSDAKFYASLGMRFSRFQETGLPLATQNLEYWQNTAFVGVGYKMYFTKNKHFGAQMFAGYDFLQWESAADKTSIPTDKGLFVNASLFYSF